MKKAPQYDRMFIDKATGEDRTVFHIDGGPQTNDSLGWLRRRRESVAAHRATCGCHAVVSERDGECFLPAGSARSVDEAGYVWHIDPLCKVRPEAAARLNATDGVTE